MKIEMGKLLKEPSKLGLDSDLLQKGKRSDAAFYKWISGEDSEQEISNVIEWLIDELREEDIDGLRKILLDWKKNCSAEDFQSRINVLSRLMAESHPFHVLKKELL